MKDNVNYVVNTPSGTKIEYKLHYDENQAGETSEPKEGDWIRVPYVNGGMNKRRLEVESLNRSGNTVYIDTSDPNRDKKGISDLIPDSVKAAGAVGALTVVSGVSKVKEFFGGDPIDIDIGG